MTELAQWLRQLDEDSKLHDDYDAAPVKATKERGLDKLKSNGTVRACD